MNGYLARVEVDDGLPRTITYRYDVRGQVIQRFDDKTNSSVDDIRDHHYYLDGRVMGDLSYWGQQEAEAHFELAFADIYAPGGDGLAQTSSRYVVRSGDSLQSIAERLWGDGSLWWMIAEANGMTSATQLAAGMSLTIPNKVHNQHHNAYTFKPYDPNKATGHTSPRVAKPIPAPKDKGCGGIGQIIAVIISLAVEVVVTAVLRPFLGPFAVPIGKAAGNLAYQGTSVLMGNQERISWDAVGMAGVSGLVDAFLPSIPGLPGPAGEMANRTTRELAKQGIGMATGMQDEMHWTAVGLAAGMPWAEAATGWVGSKVGEAAGKVLGPEPSPTEAVAIDGLTGMAELLVMASARTLIEGSDFGDNVLAGLPMVVLTTAGRAAERSAKAEEERGRAGSRKSGGGQPNDPRIVGVEFEQNPELIPMPNVMLDQSVETIPRESIHIPSIGIGLSPSGIQRVSTEVAGMSPLLERAGVFFVWSDGGRIQNHIIGPHGGQNPEKSQFIPELVKDVKTFQERVMIPALTAPTIVTPSVRGRSANITVDVNMGYNVGTVSAFRSLPAVNTTWVRMVPSPTLIPGVYYINTAYPYRATP